MTNATQPKPNPLPAILVYGTPSGPALTQASWFRAEDKEAVKAAAKELKFSVIELHTDADRALAAGAHEGVLKGSGRMIVGSVSAEVYRRIEEHVRKGAGAPDRVPVGRAAVAISRETRDRTKQELDPARRAIGDRRTRPRPARPIAWEALRVGATGLATYWNEQARVRRLLARASSAGSRRRLHPRWFDDPKYPPFKSRAEDVAVLHPEFRVTGK